MAEEVKHDAIAQAIADASKSFDDSIAGGMLSVRSANKALFDASLMEDPVPLWLSLWYEGEVCCLFADSNLGKSIYAVQIASHIAAKGYKVLYFDFELSDKQFQQRYTDADGVLYEFPENLYRVELNKDYLVYGDFENAIIEDIERVAVSEGAKVLIIDNLTYLCTATEKGDVAGSLMLRLMALKRRYNLSILVIAHTPKRPLSTPITQNDLAGSKKLFNFFDSVFAIGKSAKDANLRYIKQIKVRCGGFEYDSDNVIVCSIDKDGSFLQFTHICYGEEKEHLKEQTKGDRDDRIALVKRLHGEGKAQRAIASETGLSVGCVNKYIKI